MSKGGKEREVGLPGLAGVFNISRAFVAAANEASCAVQQWCPDLAEASVPSCLHRVSCFLRPALFIEIQK